MGKIRERDRSLPNHTWAHEEVETLIRLARKDMTAGEIAAETGLPENSVAAKLYRLRKAGQLPPVGRGRRKHKLTEDEDITALMARFSAACKTIKEACKRDCCAASGEGGKAGK